MKAGADLVFIDTPPRAEQAAIAAVRAADLILIPCRPAIYDLETVTTTLDLINAVRGLNLPPQFSTPSRHAGRSTNKPPTSSRIYKLPVCPASLGQRVAFDHASTLGQTAQEYDPRGKAAAEIKRVYLFMSKLVDSSTQNEKDQWQRKPTCVRPC